MTDSARPKRILFVDDEPALLDSLTRVMRPLKSEWEIAVEGSPNAALDRLSKERFDIVVTDLRLPVLNGVPVVSQIMERSPDSIRVALKPSQPENQQTTLAATHQVVARADLENLRETVERITRMRDRMHDENMRALIGDIDGLPAVPAVCQELNRTLAQNDFSMRDVASVVEKDPALCAKILQLVNSPFFGLGRKLTQLHDAVAYLGTSMLKNLVTSVTLWRTLEGVRPAAIGQLSRVHGRCQRVGGLARRMMSKDRVRGEEAFVSGLLHDIGITLLIAYLPERHDRIAAEMLKTGLSFYEVERSLYSVDHAEIGAHLLDAWGLPFQVLESVAFHHSAPNLRHTRLEPADAVYIAQALIDAHDREQPKDECIDNSYLEQLGVVDQFPEWCAWLEEA